MVLALLLPGGREHWFGSNDSSCSTAPITIATIALFLLAKSDCFTHRFLLYVTVSLTVYLFWTTIGLTFPAWILQGLVAAAVLAHLPAMNGTNSYRFLGYMAFVMAGWLTGLTEEVAVISFVGAMALFGYRMYVHVITLKASTPLPMIFPIISHIVPRYHFSEYQFFRADHPPEEIAKKREDSFKRLKLQWDKKWAKGLEVSSYLSQSFSDLRFAGSNRVFIPFMKVLETWCDPCTVITKADRVNLIDTDGHELMDIAGSYGVNVCGYEKYKEFITEGWEMTKDVGCVLGPIHPILKENIEMLKKISKKEEISFHMSGTEAVMCAVRLVRFNTEKNLIVLFNSAYHGWADLVQPSAGNERTPFEILTLLDMNPNALELLRLRKNEIAAVVINPLQAFHPNQPPPSDLVLASNNRQNVSDSTLSYQKWLIQMRQVCTELGIVLIFDEVYTGFRLAPGGAQEYFQVTADMVVYGKTVGGGIPNGIVCGPRRLMKRNDEKKPLRVAYVIGTFAAHPLLLGAMNRFLKFVTAPGTKKQYDDLRKMVADWVTETNTILKKEFGKDFNGASPIELSSYSSVWTMMYKIPGRYHWMLQYYLKDEGINLSWVGTGRLSFSLDFTPADLIKLRDCIIRACRRMRDDGWWYVASEEERKKSDMKIKISLAKEMAMALFRRIKG